MPSDPSPNPAPRRRWIRRHPIATAICLVVGALLALAIAFPGDEGRASIIGSALVAAVLVALAVCLATWLIDKVKARRTGETGPSDTQAMSMSPSKSTPVTPLPTFPPRSSPVPGPPDASPADVSAFEETALAHIPEQPPQDPNRYRPITLGAILERSATEFEQLCVRVLLTLGYTDVRRTGGAGDLGADVVGTDPQGRSIIVQCKRYAPGNAVGSPTIQTFIGMKTVHHKADRGIVMTTAEFSRPAIQLAKEHDIALIDGDDIVKVLNLTGSR